MATTASWRRRPSSLPQRRPCPWATPLGLCLQRLRSSLSLGAASGRATGCCCCCGCYAAPCPVRRAARARLGSRRGRRRRRSSARVCHGGIVVWRPPLRQRHCQGRRAAVLSAERGRAVHVLWLAPRPTGRVGRLCGARLVCAPPRPPARHAALPFRQPLVWGCPSGRRCGAGAAPRCGLGLPVVGRHRAGGGPRAARRVLGCCCRSGTGRQLCAECPRGRGAPRRRLARKRRARRRSELGAQTRRTAGRCDDSPTMGDCCDAQTSSARERAGRRVRELHRGYAAGYERRGRGCCRRWCGRRRQRQESLSRPQLCRPAALLKCQARCRCGRRCCSRAQGNVLGDGGPSCRPAVERRLWRRHTVPG